MSFNFIKIAKVLLKTVAAIAGGLAAFLGISKIMDSTNKKDTSEEELSSEENNDEKEESLGRKIMKGIHLGQTVLSGAMGIVQGVNSVSNSINKMFKPGYYNTRPKDPWEQQDYNMPYDTPIYQGKDNIGDDIYWVRRGNNVIEVW